MIVPSLALILLLLLSLCAASHDLPLDRSRQESFDRADASGKLQHLKFTISDSSPELLHAVHKLQTSYGSWKRFVEMFLDLYNQYALHSDDVEIDFVYARKLLSLGLQLFPRCAGLNFATALAYTTTAYLENDLRHYMYAIKLFERAIESHIADWKHDVPSVETFLPLAKMNIEFLLQTLSDHGVANYNKIEASCCPEIEPTALQRFSFVVNGTDETKLPSITETSGRGLHLHVGCSDTENCPKFGWTVVADIFLFLELCSSVLSSSLA